MNSLESLTQLMKLQTKLLTEEHIPLPYAGVLAEYALNHFDDAAKQGVLQWLSGELTDDFSVNGSTIGKLKQYMGISDFTALCILNTRITNPGAAKAIAWFEEKPML